MGTDRLNLLKLSARVGFGCKCGVCGWILCAVDPQCVCVFVLHIRFLDSECVEGLSVSSGWDVSWLCRVRCIRRAYGLCVHFYLTQALPPTGQVMLCNHDQPTEAY